jgi:putative transposase
MLAVEQDERLVAVGAYCLMPNHFHVLAKEVTEDGISRFMRKLLTAYSMFFNSRHDRSGTLFEGRYKAKHVDSDEYLRYLYAYIHLNPVKLLDSEWKEKDDIDTLRIKDYLEKYDYSSYQTYLGKDTLQQHVLSKTEFPEYFTKAADFSTLIHDWLTLKEQYRK